MTQAHTTTAAKLPRLRKPKPVAPRSRSRPAPVQDQVTDFAQAIAKLPPPPRGYAVVDPALVPDTMLDRTVMLYDDTLKRWCLFDGFNPGVVSTAWNAVRGTFFAVKVEGTEPETISSNNSRVDIEPPYWCELGAGAGADADTADSFTYNADVSLQEPTQDLDLKWVTGRGWVRVQPGFVLRVGGHYGNLTLRARAINPDWLAWRKRHSAVVPARVWDADTTKYGISAGEWRVGSDTSVTSSTGDRIATIWVGGKDLSLVKANAKAVAAVPVMLGALELSAAVLEYLTRPEYEASDLRGSAADALNLVKELLDGLRVKPVVKTKTVKKHGRK